MNRRKGISRLLSLLLTAALLVSLLTPAVLAAPGEENRGLELTELDPASLKVPKLGQTEEVPSQGAEQAPYALNDLVRVSILLEEEATLDRYSMKDLAQNPQALAYREGLRAQQDAMQARIEAATGKALTVKWNITLAANILSAELRYGDIDTVKQLPGVARVVIEKRYEAPSDEVRGGAAEPNTANTSENMTGALDAWKLGYTGAGSRIAIIDTGIDPNHQSFADEPFLHAIQEAGAEGELMKTGDISAVLSQLNAKQKMSSVTADQLNGGRSKIVYGFNYVDGNTTIDHMSDTQGNHGSHVAGIAAANRYIGSAHQDATEAVGAVGMAPDAQLLVMKVFGEKGGAYDSDYMVAIEDAILLDCDAVNLSLGSGSQGWTFDETYQDILNNLTNKAHNEGMVVSISAGNSYDFAFATGSRNLYKDDVHYHTGGSPGSFVNSLGVAAAQNTLTKGTPMNFDGVGDVFYYESTGNEEEGTTYTNPALSTIKGSYSYVYIDGVGAPEEYAAVNSAISLSGKIVIVNRGGLSFVEKGENAKSYSPKAVIIANNQDGTILMDLTDFTGSFPMVTITQKDANKIKAASATQTAGGYPVYTGSVEVTDVEKSVTIDRSQATITDFSSWGVPGSLIMKPEITAPGGDIYSVNGTNKTSSGSAGGTDQYVSYSGTSMAAPHIAGLTGLLAEYLREHPISDRNQELSDSYSTRAILQSLLMSTATPMAPENEYLSILQQGAGLAEAAKAIQSPSVIMMSDEGNTLTVRTGANADGKIKAELGDDPEKTGKYSFGFMVYNLTDNDLTYELDTDLFSQKISGEFLAHGTSLLPAGGVSYSWNGQGAAQTGHDVNKDGQTNEADADAILAWLAGTAAEAELDLTGADLDGDGDVTSQDAYLLLDWKPQEQAEAGYTVPAHSSAEVVVSIELTAAQREALAAYAKGAYLEGFTYLNCSDGSQHSIPILGFYGSWTEPSMFDNMSYVDGLYGAERIPYSGTADTNYLLLNYAGANVKFSGNPYMVEDQFPAQRLAVNSSTKLLRISYNLIRSAATTGFAVSKLDADRKLTEVVSSAVTGNGVLGQWYYANQGSWQNTMTKVYSINKTPGAYGLSQGDLFRVGFYAIPEYNGMVVNESYNEGTSGMLDQSGFNKLLLSNSLGRGAFVGYDFTVDDTAPQITNAALNGNTLSVSASDNLNLAYVAVLSLDGSVKYAEAAPGAASYTISFNASEAIANAQGYVAVFAGDYAGNEAAVAVKVNNNTHVEKTVYVLTDSLTADNDYVIAEANAAGTAHVLGYTAGSYSNTVTAAAVTVKAGSSDTGGKPYIETADVPATAVWTASSGVKLMNGSNYLRHTSNTSNTLNISTTNSYNTWTYTASSNILAVGSRYLRYYNNTYSLSTATTNKIYLYVKTTISYEVDPYAVSGVTVTPESLDLYKGAAADLTAKVTPLTASDRTVSWSSSDNGVATVDQNGHVTAVAKGTATITASSNANPAVKGSCTVNVEAVNKELSAIIWDEEGSVFFSYFNTNNLPNWTKRSNNGVTVEGNPLYLHNAVMIDSSNLYASTLDISDTSILYSVDRGSYAVTEYGTNYVPAFGMARVGSTFGTGYYVYGFAKYLIFGNLAPETNDELGTFSGFPYGLLDLSTTNVGDAYVVGICARTVSTTSASYYFLDETGKIWQSNQTYSSSDGISFSTPTLVVDTGLSAGLQYQSLYYDGTWIYWSRKADNVSELILYNPSTGKLYNAGNFGEGVWPAAGLYVDGAAAPASVEEPLEAPELKPLGVSRDELMSHEIMARFAAAQEERQNGAQPIPGSLNAVQGSAGPVRSTDNSSASVEDNNQILVTIKETKAVHNGLLTVEYDPELLTYTGVNTPLAHYAVGVDAEKGVLTIAYADLTERGGALFTLRFSAEEDSLNTALIVNTLERNEELNLDEATEISLRKGFLDVTNPDSWFYKPVYWAVKEGITNGVSADRFAPNQACTRAQVVTFLWRLAGEPEPAGSNSFTDVSSNAWYAKAVQWAAEQEITKGTSETGFSPNQPCTRAQVVTFLWRYAHKPAATGSNPFADVSADAYYAEAVQWAVNQGITNGTSANAFSPNTVCTRSQVVTFLWRYAN